MCHVIISLKMVIRNCHPKLSFDISCDWQKEAKTKWILDVNLFLEMNPFNSKQNRGLFSNGKWRAIDMLVDHESGTDNPVGEVNAK